MKKILLFLVVCVLSSSLLFSQNIGLTVDVNQPTCPGQTATVYANVTISTNYTLFWSNGSTMSYNYLIAGTYSVTATDVPTGDTAIAIVVIIDPPGLTLTAQSPFSICSGTSTGSINLAVSGNTAPYTYNWSNGSTNQDLYNIPAGLYSVTVTDVNYCPYYLNSIEVSELPATILSISSVNATCESSDGSVSASPGVTGGTFYYLWDDPGYSASDTVYNLPAGIYHVTVTTDQGCLSYGSATVNNIGAPFLVPYNTGILCNGLNTGSAWVNPQSGTPPFSYLWSNNDTLYLADSLFAGPISVTVTDSFGCKSIRAFDITQPPAFNVYLNKNNVPCSNSTGGGSMWLTVEGGTPNYSFIWSNNAVTSDIYDLSAGIYSVTVTDANSCTVILSDTIFDAVPIVVDTLITDPSCYGSSNGSVDITVTGGAPPYSYFWSGGLNYYSYNEDASGMPAGYYSLNVNDTYGCSVYKTIILTNPPAMYVDANITNVICYGDSTGAIDITIYDGFAPYTFSWYHTAGGVKQNYSSGNLLYGNGFISNQEDLTNVSAGWYNVEITDSLGCALNQGFNIYENSAISFNLYPSSNPHCGISDGSLTSQPIYGGLPPYTFIWSNGDTSSYADSLAAGIYLLTVTDSAGCSNKNSVILNNIVGPILYLNSTGISCYGFADGSASVSSSISDTYLWSNSSTSDTITGLIDGTYYVSVTDTSGCVSIGSVTIYQPEQLKITFYTISPTCAGDANGFISANVTGGSWEWDILWSNDSTNSYFSNVSSGTYTLTVTDAMNPGCQKVDSVVIVEPPPIVISGITSTDVTCYGMYDGTITINASAGGETLEYSIDETGFYPQNVFTGRSPGTYRIHVRFASGYSCIDTSANDVIISEPTQLSGLFEQTNITCYGASNGTITITPFGGTPPYQYSIDGEITFGPDSLFTNLAVWDYSLKIKDANGCLYKPGDATLTEPANINMSLSGSSLNCNGDANGQAEMIVYGAFPPYSFEWSNNSTTQNIMNLVAGTYVVTVTDSHNCNYIDSAVVDEPQAIQIDYNATNALCFGSSDGTIDLLLSGGIPSYSFWWADTAFTQTRTNLYAGTYFVTVTDNHGCLSSVSIDITEPFAPLYPSINTVDVSCNGFQNGIAYGNASGGTVPYSFFWSTDATSDSITDLAPGIYMLTVTDDNGCWTADTFIISEPSPLIITFFDVVNPTCFGYSNGSIIVSATGGSGSLQFTLDSVNFQSTGVFNSLSAGSYTIEVIDANNCYITIPVQTLSDPSQLVIAITSSNVSCFGGGDGAATVSVTGGTIPYSYLWSNGAISQNLSNVIAGTYYVTVFDSNNCSITDTAILTQPSILVSSVTSTNVTCFGLCDGTATVVATGGTGSYTYSWNTTPSSTVPTVTVCAGLYSVTVTDQFSCTTSSSANITEPEAISLAISSTVSACNICNGTATVTPTGGTFPYSYLWSNNDVLIIADSLCAGTVVVTVTDINGCFATSTITVTSQPLSAISGEAHWTGGNLPDNTATVEMYRILNTTQAELAHTLPLSGSQFTFSNVEYGKYFVKVKVTDGALLPNVLSTYLDSTYLWELADTVNVTCANNYSLHVPMYEMTQPVGPPIGVISGYITYGDYLGGGKGITAVEGAKLAGEPVPGAEIYVELEPDDEPITNTTTNDTGYYEVSGLEGGNTYSMSVDIPGLPMITTYTNISINSDSTVYTQMNFYVDTSETNGGIFISTSTPVIKHENAAFNLEMYPNPFSDYMNINYSLNKSGNVNLEIYDILGKVVATLINEKQLEGAYKYVFNASGANLAEGTYIVKLQVDNTVFIKKILQIK